MRQATNPCEGSGAGRARERGRERKREEERGGERQNLPLVYPVLVLFASPASAFLCTASYSNCELSLVSRADSEEILLKKKSLTGGNSLQLQLRKSHRRERERVSSHLREEFETCQTDRVSWSFFDEIEDEKTYPSKIFRKREVYSSRINNFQGRNVSDVCFVLLFYLFPQMNFFCRVSRFIWFFINLKKTVFSPPAQR